VAGPGLPKRQPGRRQAQAPRSIQGLRALSCIGTLTSGSGALSRGEESRNAFTRSCPVSYSPSANVSRHGSLGRSDRGNQGNGRRLGVAAGWGMARPSWWTLSPRPPGIYRFLPCSSRGDKEEPGEPPRKSTRRSAVCRAPVGARVPSLESSILRWSKGGYFPFPFPWGCLGWERGKVRLSW